MIKKILVAFSFSMVITNLAASEPSQGKSTGNTRKINHPADQAVDRIIESITSYHNTLKQDPSLASNVAQCDSQVAQLKTQLQSGHNCIKQSASQRKQCVAASSNNLAQSISVYWSCLSQALYQQPKS